MAEMDIEVIEAIDKHGIIDSIDVIDKNAPYQQHRWHR
jgi:hypothetical protein